MRRLRLARAALVRNLTAGMAARVSIQLLGALTALAVSAPLIVVLFLHTSLGIGASTFFGCVVQLSLGWIIAGWFERRDRNDSGTVTG